MPDSTTGERTRGKALVARLKQRQAQRLEEELLGKRLHGKHAATIRGEETDRRATNAWLTKGRFQARTEALVCAAQDQVIYTNVYRAKIMDERVSPQCRRCEAEETIGHIVSSCQEYNWTFYKNRHDRVLYQLVKAIAGGLGLKIPNALRGPGGVLRPGTMGAGGRKILVDQVVPTEGRVEHSRPDLVVRVDKERRIVILDVACAWDTSIGKRRKEKLDRYVELAADLANQHTGYRVTTIPVVCGDLGTIGSLRKDLRKSKLRRLRLLCWKHN